MANQTILENTFMSVTLNLAPRVLTLTWLPATESMDTGGFKECLLGFAKAAEHHRPRAIIIDVRAFKHTPAAEVAPWRDQEVIPRYNRGGVQRFAFVHGQGTKVPPHEAPRDGGPRYATRHFDSPEAAGNWISLAKEVQITVKYRVRADVDVSELHDKISAFLDEISTQHPRVTYTSRASLVDDRSFIHVVETTDPEALKTLQGAPFFGEFAKYLKPLCEAGPEVDRYSVVATTATV